MQDFKIIQFPNKPAKVQIEGVGEIAQIEMRYKLYNLRKIDYKVLIMAQCISLSERLINMAINELGLYPREF